MSAPVCSCGHLVVDDRRCACISRCPTCSSEDCCAETWAIYEHDPSLFMGPNGEYSGRLGASDAEAAS